MMIYAVEVTRGAFRHGQLNDYERGEEGMMVTSMHPLSSTPDQRLEQHIDPIRPRTTDTLEDIDSRHRVSTDLSNHNTARVTDCTQSPFLL